MGKPTMASLLPFIMSDMGGPSGADYMPPVPGPMPEARTRKTAKEKKKDKRNRKRRGF